MEKERLMVWLWVLGCGMGSFAHAMDKGGVADSLPPALADDLLPDPVEDRVLAGEKKEPKIVYQQRTELDFEGTQIEGELHTPGEFYFQHKPEDKMDSLVKRRKNFHRQMLRDVVFSK